MEELEKEELRAQKMEEVLKEITDALDMTEIEELLKSNEKIFTIEGITYRVRKPSYREKQELYQKRMEKFTELLNNEKYYLEEDLKKLYKKRNIDVDNITLEINNKINRRNDLMIQLGELLKNNSPESDLEKYKDEILILQNEIKSLSLNKSRLLEFSIEKQVLNFIYTHLTFLISEKKEGDNWVKVWNTYDDFQNDSSSLANQLSFYATFMGNVE